MTEQKACAVEHMTPYEVAEYINGVLESLPKDDNWYVYSTDITWRSFESQGDIYIQGFGIVIFEKFNPIITSVVEKKELDYTVSGRISSDKDVDNDNVM